MAKTRRGLRVRWRDRIVFEGIPVDCHLDRSAKTILLRRGLRKDRTAVAIDVATLLYKLPVRPQQISKKYPHSYTFKHKKTGARLVILPNQQKGNPHESKSQKTHAASTTSRHR